MATFHTKTVSKCDDYMTPKSAWEAISHIIPKDKIIWEAFFGDGQSGKDLTDLGFNVIHEDIDFFDNDLGEVIVTNLPYSQSKKVIERLAELDKPFIIIFPASKICTNYMRENFKGKDLQIVIPRRRIHFIKKVDGEVPDNWKNKCNFDCFYYCYKIGLESDITWLE